MYEVWTTQLVKGLAELALLHVLKQGETYGYEVMQKLSKYECLAFGESTIYPLFAKLVAGDFISVRTKPSNSGPPRRYYRLTKLGELRLREMDAHWGEVIKSFEQLKESKI
jgi:PadR family transcriptional regulator, regulatory protein PadR